MSKVPRTFSLDEKNDEYMSKQDNASAIVNEFITELRNGAKRQEVAVDLQIKHKQEELNEAERNTERLQRQLDELRQLKRERTKVEGAKLSDAVDVLSTLDDELLNVDNDAVQHQADKLGIPAEEVIAEVKQRTA